MKVAELIDEDNGVWRQDMIREIFSEEESRMICDVPLVPTLPNDQRFWWPTKDGCFSVKTCYWLGRLGHVASWSAQAGIIDERVWRTIWNLDGPPKLSHFLWRVCSGNLAVRERLYARHITQHASC